MAVGFLVPNITAAAAVAVTEAMAATPTITATMDLAVLVEVDRVPMVAHRVHMHWELLLLELLAISAPVAMLAVVAVSVRCRKTIITTTEVEPLLWSSVAVAVVAVRSLS